ncbi:MAG: pantetheine-phosphate adenylyltransferase [Flavobacteriales bacterium]|nr:pantetheine-phosphate adenylyltransferase [Flavobacteriales bacterium]
MQRIAVFPGTFDPFTNGHKDIVEKGLLLFDEVIIAIGVNALKKSMFPLEKRMEWIRGVFSGEDRVRVSFYEGLTIDFCLENNAGFLLRGLRTIADFEYERQIAFVNSEMNRDVHSVFVMSDQRHSTVSSTIVRDIILHKGNYTRFIPPEVRVDEVKIG